MHRFATRGYLLCSPVWVLANCGSNVPGATPGDGGEDSTIDASTDTVDSAPDDATTESSADSGDASADADGAAADGTVDGDGAGDSGPCSICNGACVNVQIDSLNCGGCGIACGGTCTGGRCLVTLATLQNGPHGIAVDATSVYWTNQYGGTVMKVPIDGGVQVALASGEPAPYGLAIDTTDAYWVNWATQPGLMKVPLAGGNVTTLSTAIGLWGVAVNATSVFATGPGVWQMPLDGGDASLISSGNLVVGNPVAADSDNVYWSGLYYVGEDGGVVDSGTFLNAWCDVVRTPLADVDGGAGGGPSVLVAWRNGSGCTTASAIAVDATNLYVAEDDQTGPNSMNGVILQVPIAGGSAITIASAQVDSIYDIAVDATSVYWTSFGSIKKTPIGGGAIITLVSGNDEFADVAVDSTSVYWTDWSSGNVLKLTPK